MSRFRRRRGEFMSKVLELNSFEWGGAFEKSDKLTPGVNQETPSIGFVGHYM